MAKQISTDQILTELPKKDIADLQAISRKCAEILSEKEKETERLIAENEEKLRMIRGSK